MEHKMILSASGWRKVFAESGDGEDSSPNIGSTNKALCALIGQTFADFIISRTGKSSPIVAVGMDTRPTGKEIIDIILRVLIANKLTIRYIGIAAAPEIMAYARGLDGFLYVSASHNPIGHNGIKFGLNDGGVLPGNTISKLARNFTAKCEQEDAEEYALNIVNQCPEGELNLVYTLSDQYKKEALWTYEDFIRTVITGTQNIKEQDLVFDTIRKGLSERPLSVVCDMNGSSRTLSIDKRFIPGCGIDFLPFNNEAGHIAHAIIPEPENLVHCADVMQDLRRDGNEDVLLGYMPDCDGDRGNIVYWDYNVDLARTIPAQTVFALSVLAESAFDIWKQEYLPRHSLLWKASTKYRKKAVVVNCPTSMRIDEICKVFGIEVFRAEVGEANVVNLAREKRVTGYEVRILGEGSNGGNITYPSSVRDPVATLFAIAKLLLIRDSKNEDGTITKGLFHIWCDKSGNDLGYREDFTLSDIIKTLPAYTTTGVSEQRAILNVQTEDKGRLKELFQVIFESEWEIHREEMEAIYEIYSYQAVLTNGTKEVSGALNWNNGNGGLKIKFFDAEERPVRVMCDVKTGEEVAERTLLRWETSMIRKADAASSADGSSQSSPMEEVDPTQVIDDEEEL